MFNSSLRRVARSCPHATIPTRSQPSSHPAITASFTTHCHQRRHSSSKPPIPPNNGSPPIPASSVKQVGAPSSENQHTTESQQAKRKVAKGDRTDTLKQQEDSSNEWTKNLPRVPSTQHLNPIDVFAAAFFSIHRPISISGPLPPEASMADVDKIFQPRPKSSKKRTQDVIYTLNSAVQNLDEQISNTQPGASQQEAIAQRAEFIKALTQHNEGKTGSNDTSNSQQVEGQSSNTLRNASKLRLVLQENSRRIRPYNVPPAPVAVPELEFFPSKEKKPRKAHAEHSIDIVAENSQAQHNEIKILRQDAEPQVQHVIIPTAISENSSTSKTSDFFTSHQPQRSSKAKGGRTARGLYLIRDFQKFRMPSALRKPYEMHLISVKRQRALKMKKHKHKKLLRKTRNLRRRQGKI